MASRSLRSAKRPRSVSPITKIPTGTVARPSESGRSITTVPESPRKAKKLKLQASFVVESPFPHFNHPSPAEALEVYQLLSSVHPEAKASRTSPSSSNNSAKTCAHVPNVIEALIGTILSQNTSGKNSTRAKECLDSVFGKNNFAAIAAASPEKLVDAIRSGGLANRKAAIIQKALHSIKERHGEYSLQHLALEEDGKRMADDEIMRELLTYDGVGPKTASCVLLFCLGRDSFAVDTHVFRLSKLLGWVPTNADRVLTQAHLDLRIPDDLKYGLHVLMIQHGRLCRGCKNSGSTKECVLKTYRRAKSDSLAQSRGIMLKEEYEERVS